MKSLIRSLTIAASLAAGAAPVVAAAQAPAAEGERAGPATMGPAQLDESKRTAEADRLRDEQIEQLKGIIPEFPPGDDRSELLFQLAELWIEKSKYFYFNEWEAHIAKQTAFNECQDEKGLGNCGPEPKIDNAQSELYREEALRLYEQILKDSPTYPRKDTVLFALAVNLYEKGDKAGAIKRYRDLVTQYPQSEFAGDAYVAMGEHYFGANELAKAQVAYESALESSVNEPRIYNYALYKLAWCAYNAGDYEGSLGKLQEVVRRSEAGTTRNEVQLKWEALRDMVLSWQKLEAVGEAWDYYHRATSKDRARDDYFRKLADAYFGAGEHDLAIQSYTMLIDDAPQDKRAPEYQSNIVRSYEGLRQRDKVLEQMRVLVNEYKPGSAWAVANKDNKAAIASAYELTEGAMRELVTEYHQEAQKTKEVRTYRLAADIYKEYLDSFADSEHAYNLRFYYAEILWTLEEWELAAEQYELTYARDPNGSYSKTAAWNALLAYEKLIAIDKGELERSRLRDDQKVDENKSKGKAKKSKRVSTSQIDKNTAEEEIPKWELKMIAAADRYADIAAKDKRLEADEINVRYRAAFIYYDRKHFTEAAKRFGEIILKWPTDTNAQKAADLSLNILEVKEEWYDLARLSRAFYENKKLAKPGAKWTADLAKIMEGAQYTYIDKVIYQKNEDFPQAAKMFREFVAEFPKSQYSDRALRYAVEIYERAKELDRGIEVGEQLIAEYPKSEFAAPTVLTLAGFYELTADFAKAAAYYKRYAYDWEEQVGIRAKEGDRKPKLKKPEDVIKANQDAAKRASDALYNAALWTEGLGRFDEAISLYREYMARYRTVKDGISPAALALNIALIREKEQDWARAEAAFGEFIKSYEKTASPGEIFWARYRQAHALERMGKKADAAKLLDVVGKDFARLSDKEKARIDYRDAYAHALFVRIEPQWRKYKAVTFQKVSQLKNSLTAKLKGQQEIEKAYTEVLNTGSGDWGIAALTRIGMMYQDFARNFIESPTPPGFDFDQEMLYRSELENRAFPLEEKAVEAFELALAKSYELKVYNEYTLEAQNALNHFNPGAYGEIRQVNFTGSEFFSGAPAALAIDSSFGNVLEGAKAVEAKAEAEVATDAGAEGEDADAEAVAEEAVADEAPAPKKGALILDEAAAN